MLFNLRHFDIYADNFCTIHKFWCALCISPTFNLLKSIGLGTTLSDPTVRVESGKSSSSIAPVGLDEESDDKKNVVVKLWNNGFSLDDGPLRLYTDPSSVQFMGAIRAGLIPTVSFLL
ncbi:unnamed protein product [Rodentolepis nana]|uniref:SEP domain-containing protein n=1 Tax=Rodentolepis nana TaxID=102285 RepID=A0A0R3TJ09_RODNA|nr:unnamed protein product [Rodentolepis nana]